MAQVLFDRLKSNLAQCINDGTIYFVKDSNGNFTQIALGDGSKSHVVGIGPKMDDATKQELMSKLGLTTSSDMGTIQLGKLANHNGVSSQKVVTYERNGLGTDVHEISTVGYVQQYMKTAQAMVYAGVFNAQTKEITDYNNAIISPSEAGNVTFDYLLNGNEGETLLTSGMSFIVGTAGNLEGYTGISVYGGETRVEAGDMIIIINVHQKEGDEGGSTYNEASILVIQNTNLNIADGAITTAKIADAAVTNEKLSTDIQSLISNLSKTATFAGIATPTTNPGTPEGHVFYIANGKGIYTNFGGIDVTEDEVIILYYDNIWHKEVTGIASNDKVAELEDKVSEVNKEFIETGEDSIIIKDNDGNVLAEITPNGSAFKNLKNNGKDVLTEHQDISGLATKDEIEKKQDHIDGIDSTQEETDEEEIIFGESDVDRAMTVRKDKVIIHKSLVDGELNPIKSVEVGRKRNVYTLDSSLLSGLIWGGDKVYRGSDTVNSYVIALDDTPLILSFVGSNPFSMVMFDTMPEIGSVGRKVDFTRIVYPSEGKYVMLSGKVNEFPSELVVKSFGFELNGFKELQDSLNGKTIAVFGDSVMEGVAAFDGVSCPDYLSMYTNAKVINCAIGGTRIVPRNTTSEVLDNSVTCYNRLDIPNLISAKINGDLTEQINAAEWVGINASHPRAKVQVNKLNNLDLSSVDIFIIEGGGNDFMSAEKSKDEICQGLQQVIQILMTNFHNARIYYICPTVEWYIDRDESHYSDVYDFGKGFTLKELVEGLNKTAHDMCIPYYDAYHRLGWNRFNFNQYFRTNTTHPETGYEYMAQKIGAFLVNDMFK